MIAAAAAAVRSIMVVALRLSHGEEEGGKRTRRPVNRPGRSVVAFELGASAAALIWMMWMFPGLRMPMPS